MFPFFYLPYQVWYKSTYSEKVLAYSNIRQKFEQPDNQNPVKGHSLMPRNRESHHTAWLCILQHDTQENNVNLHNDFVVLSIQKEGGLQV